MHNRNKGQELSKSIVYGRNSVLELLKAGKRTVNKLMISSTARGTVVSEIIKLVKEKGIAIHSVPPEKLDKFSKNSQGIVVEVSPVEYIELQNLIDKIKQYYKPLLVILDGINDPHNFGAIVRNCVAFGVDGIIIPKWRAVSVNETVSKSSSGAVEHIQISKVININQAINLLKENKFWIVGAEKGGQILGEVDFPFPIAIVMGSEGFGLHNLTKKHCDFLISIPQRNIISSLNASCASSIILYEIAKKRKQ
ncbi:MAG: 23S rRNA (guanosine(2251)-2'-O)-methyltransferase RlmB [Endomicrobium sp.]|jgi:23S rRNA (guanosine2251-2'-O)-methyltransferase|nr:23S rRNA (guanosine(2251)-2'-O)-methyltransferase RlmB [Endomicrobium sp.]